VQTNSAALWQLEVKASLLRNVETGELETNTMFSFLLQCLNTDVKIDYLYNF
jgi:hypothetical protein